MHRFKHCEIQLGQEADKLTGPQKAVVLLLAFGLSNKVIGLAMHRSPETIKGHVDALRDIFNVDSRAGIVGQAFCHGVLKACDAAETAAKATGKGVVRLLWGAAVAGTLFGSGMATDDRSALRRAPRAPRTASATAKYQQQNLGVLVA